MDETQEGNSPNKGDNTSDPSINIKSEVSETSPSPLKQIRTFQGDVASALENQKESLFSIQQTEKMKRASGGFTAEEESLNESRQKSLLLGVGGIVLLVLGILGAWYGYQEFVRKSSPPTIIAPENRFISVQNEITLNFASTTRETLLSLIKEKSLEVPEGELTHFALRQGSFEGAALTTTNELLKKLNAKAPGPLARALDPFFMIGSLGQSRFIIIKLISFENAFPGMLSWEKDLPQDIGGLFADAEELKTIGPAPVFKDVIYRNKDVRVLSGTGTSTEPVLLYSFFENKMLIITENLETLRILVERLTQELLSR